MVFSNLFFIYVFLPLNILLYFLTKKIAYRNTVLIAFSLFFYAWGEPVWVFLLILTAFLDYRQGLIIEAHRGTFRAKLALAGSLAVDLGLLILFKYSGFLVENINAVLGIGLPVPQFSLPIGISFYTFQTLSYIIDVYRGQVGAQNSFWKYLMYLSSYHQLVAGPIVRYSDIAAEIENRSVTQKDISEGITRFCVGLAKKVMVANVAGKFVVQYMDAELSSLSVAGAWMGAFMFTLQIYYDFSGYSDMAIGLGRIFGFHYHMNFNYPYIAKSVTDFWRRWHMSLSSFFRDYVYIPLGGNRKHQILNILIVWFLTGLWHGASWNFVLWGVFYGLLLIAEKTFLLKALERVPGVVSHLYLLFVTLLGWTLFYTTDISRLGGYFKVMFGLGGAPLVDSQLSIGLANNLFWIIVAVVFCMPVTQGIKKHLEERAGVLQQAAAQFGSILMNMGLLFACTAMLVGQSYNPFLYFRF